MTLKIFLAEKKKKEKKNLKMTDLNRTPGNI